VQGPKIKRWILSTALAGGSGLAVWLLVERVLFDSLIGGSPFGGKIEGARHFFGRQGVFIEVTATGWWLAFWLLSALRAAALLLLFDVPLELLLKRRREHTDPAARS